MQPLTMEPLPSSSSLWRMPNVVITPHVSSNSPMTDELRLAVLRENLRRYVAGDQMLSVVDIERGYYGDKWNTRGPRDCQPAHPRAWLVVVSLTKTSPTPTSTSAVGPSSIRFADAERRRHARKARTLGRKVLSELQTLVTPHKLLRWYREMLACKWNYSHCRAPVGLAS
jgi:hypothetical protein